MIGAAATVEMFRPRASDAQINQPKLAADLSIRRLGLAIGSQHSRESARRAPTHESACQPPLSAPLAGSSPTR